ncbi:Thiamin pyrophosphokinase [Streptococcus sp. DD13]|nr:Thiamin pyrophosphokinase [Streptococcus sp. DD13]
MAGGEVTGEVPSDADVYLGVDAGSLYLLDHRLPLDLAVGDFDSVTELGLDWIRQEAQELVQLPSEKNDTDLEYALKLVFHRFPTAQVSVYGCLGGRLDHTLAAVFLASEPDLAPFMGQIELVSLDNRVQFRPKGTHQILRKEGMTYVSFMPADQTRVEIIGAKYPLNQDNYFSKKCYSSNEFIGEEITIRVDQGYVVVIYSKDRS